MSLNACIKKMGKALDQRDADAIRAIADAGLGDIEAIQQYLAEMPVTLAQAPLNMHGIPVEYTIKSRGKTTGKPSVTKVLNPKNVEKQTAALQALADANPDPLGSEASWLKMERQLLGVNQTPRAPTEMIRQANDMESWAGEFSKLTHAQKEAAGAGFATVDEMRKLYEDDQATVHTTGKLMLWGMLSRMMSAHPHEASFIDAAMNERLNEFIDTAVTREWTKADVDDYLAWVKTVIPDFAPGKPGTSNLNDFGAIFLKKMSQRDESGISKLELLHGMIADHSIPSSDVRRAYYGLNEGMGIQNKVLSFVMLMTGRTDVVVLDRIQINKMWDAGRYGKLIYDDVATMFEGAHGLARYEALERSLLTRIGALYDAVGRPQDASVGRYHWESWVLNSGQVVAHPTMQGLVNETKKMRAPYADILAPEGRFHTYAFGSTYGRSEDGTPYVLYANSGGVVHKFGLEEFKKFMAEVKRPANKIVPKKMLVEDPGPNSTGATGVTASSFSVKLFAKQGYPWYEAYGVDRGKIDQLISTFSEGRAGPAENIQQPAARGPRPDRGIFATGRSDLRNNGPAQLYTRESDPGIAEDGSLLAHYTPGPELTQLLSDAGLPAVELQELTPNPGNAAVFTASINDSKNSTEFGAAVYVYDANDYQGMRLFMTEDKTSGLAIKSDGDIVSVFSNGGGKVHSMLELAVDQGGNKLDAFDTVLPGIYAMNGFAEVSRDTWDDQYQPEGWDKETFSDFNNGEPAVVYMQYQAESTVLYQPRRSARLGILGTYSSVGKAVDELKLPQWKAEDGVANGTELWNKIKKTSGVKAEELKWLGLEEYLTMGGGRTSSRQEIQTKFSRADVATFILQRGVQVHETIADQEENNQGLEFEQIDIEMGEENWESRAAEIYSEWNVDGGLMDDFHEAQVIQDNWEKFEGFILDRATPEAVAAIADNGYARGKVDALFEAMPRSSIMTMIRGNTVFTEMAEEHADQLAQAEYKENPVRVYEASNAPGVYIVGPSHGEYDIRIGNVYPDNSVHSGISSYNEARIRAIDIAEDEELFEHDSDDNKVAKWIDYVAQGRFDNYREVKLTLPSNGDEAFRNNVHFDDDNIVTFLRVDDRDLVAAPRPSMVESVAELDEMFETISLEEYYQYEPHVQEQMFMARPIDEGFEIKKLIPQKSERHLKIAVGDDQIVLPREESVPKKTYFIDEFQSDWHQGGREHGYNTGMSSDEVGALSTQAQTLSQENVESVLELESTHNGPVYNAMGELQNIADDVQDKVDLIVVHGGKGFDYWDVIRWAVDGENSEHFDRNEAFEIIKKTPEILKIAENYSAIRAMEKKVIAEQQGVPDAPFKGDAWMQLGLKRALIQAAEQGYEQLAWVNAPVLMERWSEDYEELYKIQYDVKMTSIIKKLTGKKARQFTMAGNEVKPVPKMSAEDIQELDDDVRSIRTYVIENIQNYLAEEHGMGIGEAKGTARTYLNNVDGSLPDISMYGDTLKAINQFIIPNLQKFPGIDQYLELKPQLDAQTRSGAEGYWIIDLPEELRNKIQSEGYSLFQENRASIELQQNNQRLITLGKTSDPSSFLHESAHLFLELEKQLSREFGNQPHTQPLLDWLGVDTFDDITAEEHEKFAETFEVYLQEGKAPSLGLRQAFAAFRRWLTAIYKAMDPRVRADLTPEIVEYFDRMLATDAEIEQLKGNPAYDQFFKDQPSSGMTEAEWEKYQERRLKAEDKATNTLDQKLIKELTRRKTADWKAEKQPMVEEEKERLRKTPVYAILTDLVANPMDFQAVKELNDGKLPGNMTGKAKTDGIDPAEYAELYGYPSATAMIKDIAAAPALSKAADEAAEARMIQKHGDILNDGSIEQEARDAMHNEEQAKVLLAELKALDKNTTIDLTYLKSEARRLIGGLKFADIKPGKYYRAEIRAAKKAATAKTPAEAFEAKAQQAANHYLYKEAVETREAMERHRKYVKAAQTRKYSTKQVDPRFIQNIKAVANLYDLRKNQDRVISATSIVEWYQAQMLDPNQLMDITLLDPGLLRLLEVKTATGVIDQSFQLAGFDDLTAEDLRGLYDQLRHMRYVGGMMSEEGKAEAAVNRLALSESVIENGGNDKNETRGVPTRSTSAARKFSHLVNKIPSLRNLMRKLDGFDEDGAAYNIIFRTVEQGFSHKLKLQTELHAAYEEGLDDIHKIGLKRGAKDKKVYTLDNGSTFALHSEGRFMMALYWGTESSRDALREGYGVSDNDVMKILSDLTVEQLELVNTTWTINESVWPMLSEASVKMYGVAPPKLEPTPFTVNGIVLTGGHQRLFYDSTELELQAEKDKAGSQSEIMPTKAGSLHARVGSGGRPPLLDRNNIVRAVDDSIHFIAFAEPGVKLRGIINANDVKGAIERKHGVGFYRALIENVDGITGNGGSRESVPGLAKVMSHLRKAATFRHLAYSVRNVVQQFSAIPIAMHEVGFARFSSAATRMMPGTMGRSELREFVKDNSAFMANRTSLVNREVSEHLRKMHVASKAGKAWDKVTSNVFILQTMVDGEIAFPTWLASYEKAMDDHGDHAKATSAADTSVAESVGSGTDLHLGGMFQSTQNELVKTFTMFGSWFNAYFQRIYKSTNGGDFSEANNVDMFNTVLLMPTIVGVLSAALIADGPGEDPEPEDYAKWIAKQGALFLSGTVPVLRDVASAFRGFAPSTVWSAGGEFVPRTFTEIGSFMEGDQTGLKFSSDMLKLTSSVVPLPGAGNVTRFMDYTDSYNRGKEGDTFNPIQALLEGAEKN